jgi:hypothetical protein
MDQRGKEFITKTAILVDPKTADSKRVIYVTRVS